MIGRGLLKCCVEDLGPHLYSVLSCHDPRLPRERKLHSECSNTHAPSTKAISGDVAKAGKNEASVEYFITCFILFDF